MCLPMQTRITARVPDGERNNGKMSDHNPALAPQIADAARSLTAGRPLLGYRRNGQSPGRPRAAPVEPAPPPSAVSPPGAGHVRAGLVVLRVTGRRIARAPARIRDFSNQKDRCNHARNCTNRAVDSDVAWRSAALGTQPKLGVFSQRRRGGCAARRRHTAAQRPRVGALTGADTRASCYCASFNRCSPRFTCSF